MKLRKHNLKSGWEKPEFLKDKGGWLSWLAWVLFFLVACWVVFIFFSSCAVAQTIKECTMSNGFKCTVYTPKGQPPYRTIHAFHGHGFVAGSMNEQPLKSECIQLRDSGFLVISYNYQLGFLFPTKQAALNGIESGVDGYEWSQDNAEMLDIDLDHQYSFGNSAGGYIALQIPCNAIANCWGAVLDEQWLKEVPTLNIYGLKDRTVPFACGEAFGVPSCGGQWIYQELYSQGISTEQIVCDLCKHGNKIKGEPKTDYDNRMRETVVSMKNFFNKH